MSHSKTPRAFALIIALAAVLGFLSGCNSDSSSDSNPNSDGGGSDSIRIGLIVDLSGAAADLGKGDEIAANLAVDAINSAGGINGRKIELKVYDDQGDPTKTTNAATRLAYNDKVAVMIVSYSSAAASAAAAVAGQAEIPIVSSGQLDALTDPSQPWAGWLFRSTPGSSATVSFLAQYVVSKGYKEVAVSHSSLEYGTAGAAAFKAAMDEAGISVVEDVGLEPTVSDASKEGAKLIAAAPEAIVSIDYPTPTAQMIKAVRSLGSDIPIVANSSGMNESLFAIAGKEATNVYSVDIYDSTSPAAADFAEAFQAKTGKAPWNYQQAYEYANVMVAAEAIKNAKSLSGEDIKAGLHKIDCLETAIGRAGTCISYSDGDDDHEGTGPDAQVMKYLKSGSEGEAWTVDPFVYQS